MNTQTKTIIKSGLFSGIIYAGLIAGFDFLRAKEFDIYKFLLDFLIFGFFMSLAVWYNHKKKKN